MTPEMKREYFEDNYIALLASYVAGTLSDAQNMIVASHLTLKPEARSITRQMEAVSGALLEYDLKPEPLKDSALTHVLDQLDNTSYANPASAASLKHVLIDNEFDFDVPRPVHDYLNRQADFKNAGQLKWKTLLKGIEACEINGQNDQKSEILRIAPGTSVPAHTHEGEEITLLLDGAFEDETGYYQKGDLIVLDERFDHHPISDAKLGCVCISVTSAPIKMTGPLMRFLNPFLK